MKIALLTDIHSNRQAYQAVLADAGAAGAERFVILGDIVGYGGDPQWCVEQTMALADSGAVVIRGNHDQAVGDPSRSMNAAATAAIDWTRMALEPHHRAFLSRLPMTVEEEDRLYVHAEGSSPYRFNYVTDATTALEHFRGSSQRISFCGHVHRPALFGYGGSGKVAPFTPSSEIGIPLVASHRWLAVIGAVGQPRDGNPAAAYSILDTERCELSFRRVAYDIDAAAAAIRAASLPERLAARLYSGR